MNGFYVFIIFMNLFFFHRNIEVFELTIIAAAFSNIVASIFKFLKMGRYEKKSESNNYVDAFRNISGYFRLHDSKLQNPKK